MPKDEMTTVTFRIPVSEKETIEKCADELGITSSEFLRNAGKLLASFEPAFLEKINKVSESVGIGQGIAVQQLLLYYIAEEAALLSVFGGESATWARAFQVDSEGLVRGSKLSDLVYRQTVQDATAFKKKLESWSKSKSKEPLWLSNEEAKGIAKVKALRTVAV